MKGRQHKVDRVLLENLISTVRDANDFLSFKTDVNVPTVSKVISKKMKIKLIFCWDHESMIRILNSLYGSEYPDPSQNVTDRVEIK